MQNAECEWLWSSVLSESSFRTVSQYSEPNMEPDSLSFLPLITQGRPELGAEDPRRF